MTKHLDLEETVSAIAAMRVRGAAAIATAAAWGLARHLAARPGTLDELAKEAQRAARLLLAARPTAVSLRHGVAAVLGQALKAPDAHALKAEAQEAAALFARSLEASQRAIAHHGAELLRDGDAVLTHCHSSRVVAILAEAHRQGKAIQAYATETRPFRQGLLTSRALAEVGVPVTLVVDSAAWQVLRTRGIRHVLVGADTVARDGSVFNKVGTATVAALAQREGVPVHCAAGFYKFTPLGHDQVPIEERGRDEVAAPGEVPDQVRVWNPVFDRTEPGFIRAFVTEDGLRPPADAVAHALRLIPEEPAWT